MPISPRAMKMQETKKLTDVMTGYFSSIIRGSLNQAAKQATKLNFRDHGVLGFAVRQGVIRGAKIFPELFGSLTNSNSQRKTMRDGKIHWSQRPEWLSVPKKIDTIISLLQGDKLLKKENEEENKLFWTRLLGKKASPKESNKSITSVDKDSSGSFLFDSLKLLTASILKLGSVLTAMAAGLGLAGFIGDPTKNPLTTFASKTGLNLLKPGYRKDGAKIAAKGSYGKIFGGEKAAVEGAEIAAKTTGTAEKILGKEVATAVSSTSKIGKLFAEGSKVIEKASAIAVKVGTKGAEKLLSVAVKKLPLVGLGFGLKFAYDRVKEGEYTAAVFEVISGIAGLIPGLGTAVSLLIDAGLLANDIFGKQKKSIDERLMDKAKADLFATGNFEEFKAYDQNQTQQKSLINENIQSSGKYSDPNLVRLLRKYTANPQSLTQNEMKIAQEKGIVEDAERSKKLSELSVAAQRMLDTDGDKIREQEKIVQEQYKKNEKTMLDTLEGAHKITVPISGGVGGYGSVQQWVSREGVPLTEDEIQILERNKQQPLLPPMVSTSKMNKIDTSNKLDMQNNKQSNTQAPVIIDNSVKNTMMGSAGKQGASLLVPPSFVKDYTLTLYQNPSYV